MTLLTEIGKYCSRVKEEKDITLNLRCFQFKNSYRKTNFENDFTCYVALS